MILVTGGAGYIGSHTIIELLNEGFDVVAFDNFSNSSPKAIEAIESITNKSFSFVEADMLDQKAIGEIFNKYKIDAVIHFAGAKAVGESMQDPLKYYHNNILGTENLLRSMAKADVKKILFSSSATVYGNQPSPFHEDMTIGRCLNPYGQTKVIIEWMLEDLYAADKSWGSICLRYFNPVGAHESGEIGEDPLGVPANLCPAIMQVAIGRLPILSVYGTDYETEDGTCLRDYIHVVDLAKGHIAALRQLLKLEGGARAYNLGTGKGTSVWQILRGFEAITKKNIPHKVEGRRPGDISVMYADVSRAEEELGWKSEYDLSRMIEDAWRWQTKHPRGFGE